jgi:nitroreductase
VEVFDAIRTRRSIRNFTDAPVDDATVSTILEAGRWAPSWANTQCWRFVVVRDPKVKAAIAETMINIQLPDRVVDNPAKKAINTVPVLLAVCAETGKSGGKPGPAAAGGQFTYVTDKGDWFMFDAALAVENMCLAIHGLGLGTVILGLFDAPAAEKVLGVPEGLRITVLMPVGVPAREGNAPPRKEITDLVIKDRWPA